MLEAGFVDEVRALRARGDLAPQLPSMRAVGYRQAWSFLEGEIDERTMIERAVRATRQLAKRQTTWLNRWRARRVLDATRGDAAEHMLQYLEAVAILDRRS
jgi:tRNA dimethylallyltransferase